MPAIEITVAGNLARDPELRHTADGTPYAIFTVATSERIRQDDGTWSDGPVSWVRCIAWRELAEHIHDSLAKGDRVLVTGVLRQRDYETQPKDGQPGGKRTTWEVTVIDCGPSLKWSPAKIALGTHEPAREPEPAAAYDNYPPF
jgi:single-strand DNA-binding protein